MQRFGMRWAKIERCGFAAFQVAEAGNFIC